MDAFQNQHSYQNLSHVMEDTACHADETKTEVGVFFQNKHGDKAEHTTCGRIYQCGRVTKGEADQQDSDHIKGKGIEST